LVADETTGCHHDDYSGGDDCGKITLLKIV